MPLVLGDDRDVDVDVVSRFEMEELRTFDDQVSHLHTHTYTHTRFVKVVNNSPQTFITDDQSVQQLAPL